MDDKQAILAEIKGFAIDVMNPDDSELAKELYPDDEKLYLATVWYLAAKRRYDKAPEPVKTRMDYDEWVAGRTGDPHSQNEWEREIWNAALANVQQGGIEVGQPCQVFDHQKQQWVDGVYGASDSLEDGEDVAFWSDPADVRPAPQTVDLTDDEKLEDLEEAIVRLSSHDPETAHLKAARKIARALTTDKSLDELCREYNVPTTREVV